MKAEKGNKVYTIDESMKERYASEGYDIIGDDGQVILHAKGKTVSYEKYAALERELATIKSKAVKKKETE